MPEKEEKYYTISNLEWDEGVVEKKYKEFTLEMQI
jgi:hypothetical protein